jgi:outer membrane receptor for monomeric catechols
VTAADVAAGRLWIPSRYIRQIDGFPILSLDTQWDLTGVVTTGPVKHTVLIGSEQNLGVDYESGMAGVASIEKQAYTGAAGAANAIWVNSPNLAPITNINWNGPLVTNTIKNPTGVPYNDNIKFGLPWLSVPDGGNYDKDLYFFDAASLFHERLQLSAGARLDEVGANVNNAEFTTRVWTFRFGGVYKILPQLHVYVLHNQSFSPNPVAASAAFGYYIAPSRGTQDEVGLRLFSTDQRFELDASLYKISTTNVVQNNPFGNVGVVPPIPANNYVLVPGENNTGIDLSAKFNVARNTQLIATYSHYNLSQIGAPTAAGVYPEFAVNNVPSDQAALWGKYAWPTPLLRGLAFTLGDRFVGRRSAGAIGAAPAFYLNSYDAVDAGMSYGRSHWSANLLVHNIFNTYAIEDAPATNRLYPLEPREETLSLRYKF